MFKSDHPDLVKVLIKAIAKQAVHGLSRRDKLAYLTAVRRCLNGCAHGTDLTKWMEFIRISRSRHKYIRARWSPFNDPIRAYLLAHDQAMDVLQSLVLRFETGGTSPDSMFIQNIANKDKVTL